MISQVRLLQGLIIILRIFGWVVENMIFELSYIIILYREFESLSIRIFIRDFNLTGKIIVLHTINMSSILIDSKLLYSSYNLNG